MQKARASSAVVSEFASRRGEIFAESERTVHRSYPRDTNGTRRRQSSRRRRLTDSFVSLAVALAVLLALPAGIANAGETDCKSSSYGCTPGYSGSNASTSWAWRYYGGSYATTPTGYHNCTLYVAWRLAQAGMPNPGRSWGNAAQWAASIGGGNRNPSVGAIAWWGTSRGGGYGHVAYVEQVSGSNVYIRADNYVSQGGYTTSGWIPASSVELFLHPFDSGGGGTGSVADGALVNYAGNVYRIAGGAPLYISTWSVVGGPQPTQGVNDQQWNALRRSPVDGTFVVGAQTGQVYRFAGGAPLYVSTWNAFGGSQPVTVVDQAALDNAGGPSVWEHANYRPVDGTLIRGAQTGRVYQVLSGAPNWVSSWDQIGGERPYVDVDQAAIDNAGAGGVWNHLLKP